MNDKLPLTVQLCMALILLLLPNYLLAQSATVYYVPGLYYQQYDPDAGFSRELEFDVAQQGSGALDFFVTVDGGDTGSYNPRYATAPNGAQLEYYIYDNLSDRNVLRADGNPSSSQVITGSFSSGESYARRTRSYAVYVPPGQYAANAQYEDELTFTVYTGTVDSFDPASAVTETATINLAVPKSISVRLNDPGGSFGAGQTAYLLDFGVLFGGEVEEVDLLVRSTVGYYVSFSSSNNGNLARLDGSATLPYSLEVDGNTIDLSSGYTRAITGESPTTGGPRTYTLSFTIGSIAGSPQGDYEETITIDVVSR